MRTVSPVRSSSEPTTDRPVSELFTPGAALHTVLEHARDNVPAYRAAFANLNIDEATRDAHAFATRVPLLEKSTVRDAGESLLADGVDTDTLNVELTSGTEGRPIRGYMTAAERSQCALDLWARRRWWIPDLSPRDRFARFYAFRPGVDGHLITDEVLVRGQDVHLPLSNLSDDHLERLWDALVTQQPRWIHGPATALTLLALFAQRHDLEVPPVEFVELNGEFVTPYHLNVLREVFGAPVANNYGCREFWTLGYTCPGGAMHVTEKSVYVESVNEPSELIVSTLRNHTWPLIRYRQGDLGTVRPAALSVCDHAVTTMEVLRGRRADVIELASGTRLNAVMFSGVTRGLAAVLGHDPLGAYQVARVGPSSLLLRLVLKPGPLGTQEVIDRLDIELRRVLPETACAVDYEIVAGITPDPRTGKARDFVDECATSLEPAR